MRLGKTLLKCKLQSKNVLDSCIVIRNPEYFLRNFSYGNYKTNYDILEIMQDSIRGISLSLSALAFLLLLVMLGRRYPGDDYWKALWSETMTPDKIARLVFVLFFLSFSLLVVDEIVNRNSKGE